MSSGRAMRRIALVEPPYFFWDRSMDRLRQTEESIPGFGMLVMAAVARQRGYDVAIFDAKGSGETAAHVAAQIRAFAPDVVGFSATTISVTNAARIAELLKQDDREVVTVVGGPHVSAVPQRTLQALPALDYGIIGEGEIAFFELLDRLRDGKDVADSPGLVYRRADGTVAANARSPYIEDLDALPLPAWDLVPLLPRGLPTSIFSSRKSPVA